MKYLKVILTIIAFLLMLNLVKQYLPHPAQASSRQNVNIEAVGGRMIYGYSVPVTVRD